MSEQKIYDIKREEMIKTVTNIKKELNEQDIMKKNYAVKYHHFMEKYPQFEERYPSILKMIIDGKLPDAFLAVCLYFTDEANSGRMTKEQVEESMSKISKGRFFGNL